MNGVDLNDYLASVHWPAIDRALALMNRIKLTDLTTPEILGLVAIFEAADRRVNADTAPVLALIARDGEVRQP
jgi:hypothetical protein